MTHRLIVILSLVMLCFYAYAQDIEFITFDDNFTSDVTHALDAPLRAKYLRKSDNLGGQIDVNYSESLPDSIKKAISVAVGLWEDCLPLKTRFKMDVRFDFNITDMSVTVPSMKVTGNDTLYPMSYYKTYVSEDYQSDGISDGDVLFSNSVNWTCQYSQGNTASQNDLTTAMLRAIAITLGFGSTVKQNGQGNVYFYRTVSGYTSFEHMIYNDYDVPLSSIMKGRRDHDNPALHSYCEPPTGYLWVKWDDKQYKLYAPSTFVRDKSMIYLDAPTSLMHYEMPFGSSYLDVDSTTISIIRALGWKDSYPSIRIYCQDIPSTGIASAYESYLFEISNYTPEMSSLHWEFQTRTDNGEYQTVNQQSNSQTFLVTPLPFLSTSRINPEGDIDAKVILTYTLGGVEKKTSLKLTLECAPKILAVYDQTVHSNGYYTLYDYSFKVSYRGATSITLGVEQEYSSLYDIIHINEPFLAHAFLKYLSRGNMVWVDISVTNEYGTDTHTIEIPVQSPDAIHEVAADYSDTRRGRNIDHIDVYSTSGSLLKRIKSISELSNFQSSTLLLQYFDKEGQQIQTKKINLK